MMGPWAISGALLLGARLVLYEGAPDYPGPDRLWALVERHRVTHLGLSPTVIRALMAHGEEPVREPRPRSSLRVLGSTGEPWNPEPWWWYFREVGGGRCPIINYSGGTEVSGGIVGGNLLTPDQAGLLLRARASGRRRTSSTTQAQPVRGAVGELVIRAPLPGMTRGFWRDPERYEETYWSRFPGMWVHGDWARIDRRRLLVHPRPLGRHAQGRRQARRAGRGRERGGRPSRRSWRRPRSASRTRSRARRSWWSACCVPA